MGTVQPRMDTKLEDRNVNNNGEDCCGYCLENIEYIIDPRVLPCSHVFCLPCLQADFLKNKILECRICKKSHEDVEVNNLEKVERLVLSDSTEDDSPPTYCDICKNDEEIAITYCVDCGKKMCIKHDEYHDEYQRAFARYEHKKVSEEEYRAAPGRYEIQLCPKHKEEELKRACKHCLKTFCYGCTTDKKCSAKKDSLHELEDIDALSLKFKGQLSKVMNLLSSKVGDIYTLEKETTASVEEVEAKVGHMDGEVDRILEEQVAILRNKAQLLKTQIKAHKEDNSSKAEHFIAALHKKKAVMIDLWKSTNKILSDKHDIDIIGSYVKLTEEISKAADSELGYCQLPIGKMLVTTSEYHDLGVQLRESIPQLLDLHLKEKNPSGHCCCIYSNPDHSIVCGRESSINILDGSDFKPLQSLSNSPSVNGLSSHKQGYLAFHWENGKNYIILYSDQLGFMKLFGEFFRSTDKYSQLCTVNGKVVAMDPDEKQLNVYNEKGEFLFHTKLAHDKRPWGVQATVDGCVLVSDFVGGCVRKYKLVSGKEKPVWVRTDIIAPVGIAVNASGLIFVASYSGRRIYVLSPEGEKIKELTHPELHNIKEIYDITVDGELINLACGSNGVMQFRMVFGALVK